MNKKTFLFKKKLIGLLIIALSVYAITFLIFFVKLVIKLVEMKDRVEFNWSIVQQLSIEFVMFVLSALFAYICFRIRQNIKE